MLCTNLTDWEYFDTMSGCLILVNCLVLMSDHYPMDTATTDGLAVTNAMLTIIFFRKW